MKRNIKFFRSEKGQSLVLIAAAMVALLALAGLAIDGGNLFLQRRSTQRAADAMALAGTRALARAICNEPGANDAAVAEAIDRFARLNRIEDANSVTAAYVSVDEAVMGRVGAGSIPVGATGIKVIIENPVSTYFLGIVDVNTMPISASALAMTGPPLTSDELRPLGVPLSLVEALGPGDEFTIRFGNCDQPGQCVFSYAGGQLQHRGMLNLAHTWNRGEAESNWPRALNPGSSVLQEWMADGYASETPFYADCVGCGYGDYIHATSSGNSAVIEQAPVGEAILVPVYDKISHYADIPAPKPSRVSQGGDYYYHLVGFLAFKVTAASQGAGMIAGHFVNAVIESGQMNSAAGTGFGQEQACMTHLQTVSLWR